MAEHLGERVPPCEACGLPWNSPEPCTLASGRKASPSLGHVQTQVCTCRTCVESRDRAMRTPPTQKGSTDE